MFDPLDALVLDLVAWVAERPRPLPEVLERWRTSCPRLTVWEDANDRGFVTCVRGDEGGTVVQVTERGRAGLRQAGREVAPYAVGQEGPRERV